MTKIRLVHLLYLALLLLTVLPMGVSAEETRYKPGPPFELSLLEKIKLNAGPSGKAETAFNPKSAYSVFINYELGMHCVGFDVSYCCIIPPYNSIQAQAFRTGREGQLPHLISPDDGISLRYFFRDNTYSEGNKMRYWHVPKDVYATGRMDGPGDNMANYVWTHLFIYKDLAGTVPENWKEAKRLYVGKDLQVPIDSGPTGKSVAGGYLVFAGRTGGNRVFTDSLIPDVKNVPITLTSSYIWDALGLPLTAFNDSRRKGTVRSVTNSEFQPYQYAVVQPYDKNGTQLKEKGKPIEFFGTEPIDYPNCYLCHSAQGKAARLSREEGLSLFDKEYAYWKNSYPDMSEFMARQFQTMIDVLELHDRHHGTSFLKEYNSGASSNRLGATGSVYCADCHGDNISGNLQSPRPGATGYETVKAKSLSEAIHGRHAGLIPMPDGAGRTQSCQACHPSHWQPEKMNDYSNPYQILDEQGNPRFSNADLRTAGGGCYLRRDAHTNPDVKPPFFLNEIGKWYLHEVSMKDEHGRPVSTMRGLYCTNCHNHLAHELYKSDDIEDAAEQKGTTLRNRSLSEIIKAAAKGDAKRFSQYFADPIVGADGDPLRSYYEQHGPMTLVKSVKENGKLKLLPWNAGEGEAVPYEAASGGKDWWLSAGEPHCADCHLAPFVESQGGRYFPVDQPNKYSLYRYSKAHGTLACQSCHESIHGLYPVRYEGMKESVDLTSHQQALQFSPDGKYAGPVTCAACHTVNGKGVPVQLGGSEYYNDYRASVVLVHFMREDNEKLPIADLLKKFPYERSRRIVQEGWK